MIACSATPAIDVGKRGKARYRPALDNRAARLMAGIVATVAGAYFAASQCGQPLPAALFPLLIGWGISVWLTDKYRHKYPQRYYSYLMATHGKAAVVMVVITGLLGLLPLYRAVTVCTLLAALWVVVVDLVLSTPRTRMPDASGCGPTFGSTAAPRSPSMAIARTPINTPAIRRQLTELPEIAVIEGLSAVIDGLLPNEDSLGVSTAGAIEGDTVACERPLALLLQRTSLNTVRRLNLFLEGLPESVVMGGYFVFRYRPMDEYLTDLKARKHGLALWLAYGWQFLRYRALPKIPIVEKLYFAKCFSGLDSWVYRRTREDRRVISRAEMWGRMYFWGFEILGERKLGEDHWVVTRRIKEPEKGRTPSFFMIAQLTKVGLDGKPLRLHKLRTMYPFSEFVQEKIYKDHGLSETGKFRNDFRLTDYGRFLRRYWLDEIPQVFDWLRGDIKLVGMRATSPHFLSLYPKELYDLYVQTKPGLIPPIFDASTAGFDDIVRIELAYLTAYQQRPVMTDVKCLLKTFHDIFIRGVRSK